MYYIRYYGHVSKERKYNIYFRNTRYNIRNITCNITNITYNVTSTTYDINIKHTIRKITYN